MTRQSAQTLGLSLVAQDQEPPQDLNAALEAHVPGLQALLPQLPHEEALIEKVPGHDYPFGGSNDHYDMRINVGHINGKQHYVYAYLAKTTSEVKFMIYDYNDRELPLPEIDQLMKRTVRKAAFEFADNAMKMTGLVLYYFMKLGVVKIANVQDFPLAMESLGSVAKDFKDRYGINSSSAQSPIRPPLSIRLAQAPRSQQPINPYEPQDQPSIVSKFIDAENKENDLEQEIVQFDTKVAELREQKTAAERERKRLWEEMSKIDAEELGVRDGERKRHCMR